MSFDLVERKAIYWEEDETLGMKYSVRDVPEDMKEITEEWREKLVEIVCESNDDILEKFLEDRDSISVEEFIYIAFGTLYELGFSCDTSK